MKSKYLLSIHNLSTDEVAEILKCAAKVGMTLTVGKVLRFIPPLIITNEHVDEVINIIDEVLGE